jgi:glutamyl-tRNA synthetase
VKVRFAPSPTGSLHIGNALGAVANRNYGGTFLLRIDDTDPARNVAGGEQAILDDLVWLGIEWDEGPVRQSDRGDRYREAAAGLPERFADGIATYELASVVDDVDFGITHVIRGSDHRPHEPLDRALTEALGAVPPEYVHQGVILGRVGMKLWWRGVGGSFG